MTINTINSTRQDVGTAPDWRIYFSTYLYMALQTGDKEFRWIADRMLEQSESQSSIEEQCPIYPPLPYFEFMPFWLLDEKLKNTWTTQETQKPYFDYDKFFENSGIVRARQGHFSLTLLENRPVFGKACNMIRIRYICAWQVPFTHRDNLSPRVSRERKTVIE